MYIPKKTTLQCMASMKDLNRCKGIARWYQEKLMYRTMLDGEHTEMLIVYFCGRHRKVFHHLKYILY